LLVEGQRCDHNGGILRFGPDEKIYIIIGDKAAVLLLPHSMAGRMLLDATVTPNNCAQNLQEHNHFKSLEANEVIKSESSQAELEQPSALSDVPDVLTIEGPEAVHYRSVAELFDRRTPVETFELVQPPQICTKQSKLKPSSKQHRPVFNGTVHSHEVPDSNGENGLFCNFS